MNGMALELVKDYQSDNESDGAQFSKLVSVDDQMNKMIIDAVANAIIEKLTPQLEEMKQLINKPEDQILTQAQLNDVYFHSRANAIVDLTKVPGFPKFYLPGQSTPHFSLKAVQQWTQEQKQTKKYI
jgi:hypothetical protein